MSRIFILIMTLTLAWQGTCHAFWGLGGDREQESGLDLKKGYDVNTVVVLTGRVQGPPQVTGQKTVLIELKTGDQTVYLAVGTVPGWDKSGMTVKVNDELTVKGSRAQGKDGKQYLLAQKVTNRTSGTQLELRDPQGTLLGGGSSTGGVRDEAGTRRAGDRGVVRPDPLRGGGTLRGGDLMRGGGMMGGGMRR